MKFIRKYLLVTVKGICMGAADVVPGVSGGTIAFLMGIFKELVDSLKSLNIRNFKLLFSGHFSEFLIAVNARFLVSLFAGILISVFSIAGFMKYMLENKPVIIWSFFFGLIASSSCYILLQLKKWNIGHFIPLLLGAVIAVFISLASPSETPHELWFVFISGAIAVCAMILPGISGSFILLLMGQYTFIMTSVSDFNMAVLIIFACGAVTGLLCFSHVLSWLLNKYYISTIAMLSGFMIGSLVKVWPWKILSSAGASASLPVSPWKFAAVTGTPSMIMPAVLCMLAGVVIVVALEFFSSRYSSEK
ncbi:MAG: DUF368 domain-containing protein [Bacteroidales bacterium]|jgi:putative membrane protein|nr:DUF368 domain-containing protein [Bacteroidales bacterium]